MKGAIDMNRMLALLAFIMLIFSYGCAQGEAQGNGQGNYEETKKMLIDILKTDEGKEAIKEIVTDDELKASMVVEQSVVKETIEKSLTSEKAAEFWKKQFEDPKFAESFAKSIQKEHEELIKNLMKDPDYVNSLMETFQDPKMKEEILDVLRSQEYREEVKKVVTETFESPLFKAKIQDLLIKGAEEMQKGKEGEGGGEEKGGGQEGGK
jgi:spore germination protein D